MVKEILETELHHGNFEIHDGLTARDVDGWDSLTHMAIIVAIEEKFSLKFRLRELNKLTNLGTLIGLIESKISDS